MGEKWYHVRREPNKFVMETRRNTAQGGMRLSGEESREEEGCEWGTEENRLGSEVAWSKKQIICLEFEQKQRPHYRDILNFAKRMENFANRNPKKGLFAFRRRCNLCLFREKGCLILNDLRWEMRAGGTIIPWVQGPAGEHLERK